MAAYSFMLKMCAAGMQFLEKKDSQIFSWSFIFKDSAN